MNCGVLSVFREKTTPLRYTRVPFWSGSCRQFPGRPILSGDVVLSLSDCVREIFRPVSRQRPRLRHRPRHSSHPIPEEAGTGRAFVAIDEALPGHSGLPHHGRSSFPGLLPGHSGTRVHRADRGFDLFGLFYGGTRGPWFPRAQASGVLPRRRGVWCDGLRRQLDRPRHPRSHHWRPDILYSGLAYDATRQLVWEGGADRWFWIHVAQAIIFTVLAIPAFVRLARVCKRFTPGSFRHQRTAPRR